MRERLKLSGNSSQPAGPGGRPAVPARLADAIITLGVAVLGLASGFGGRSQGEQVPLAALPVLAMMGLVLYPRRRFPLAVLAAVAARNGPGSSGCCGRSGCGEASSPR